MHLRRVLLQSLRSLVSTSLLCLGFIIGITIASSPASPNDPNPHHVAVQPPATIAFDACEAETLAYLAAQVAYEDAVETLNDAWDALQGCGQNQYTPSEAQKVKLAGMRSVLENR